MAYLRRCVSVLVTLSVLLSFGVFAPPAGGTAAAAEIQVSSGESIQDAIDAAAPGDVIIVGPGTYAEDLVIDKALTVVSSDGSDATTIAGLVDIDLLDNETLVFGGEGAGFTVTNPNGPGIDATLDYWCALTIEGNAISGNDTVGLRVRRVHYFSEVEVRGNEISENGEAGIEAGAFGPAVRYHSTLSILDNVITNNGDEGIDWNDTWDNSHGLIQGNTITGNGDDGIWHDDVEHGSSLNILDNVVSDNVGRGIYIYEYEDGCEGLIQGNTIERNGEDGFYMSDDPSHGSRLTIRDNSFVQNGGFGLRMDDVEDRGYLAIIDNEIVDNESGGIRLYEVDSGAEGLISGNTITGNGGFGIYVYSGLDYGGYLLIEGNTISGTQSGVVTNEEPGGWDVEYWLEHGDVAPGSETVYVNGVPVSESDYLLVHDSGTIVFDAVPSGAVTVDYTYGGAGIYVGDEVGEGSDLAIRDNQVVDNGGKGIYVEEIERGGEVVIAEGNTISRNGAHGVVVGSRYYDSWYKEWIYYGVVDGSFLEVADNEISDNGGNGVDILLIEDGSKVLIESNTLSENAYGVYVGEMNEGSTLDILGNTITGQSSGGVYAANIDESEVNVLDNVISANTGIGLQVGEGETLSDSKATIRCNTIYNNTEWGIYMVVEHSLVDISGNHILANGTSGTEGGIHVQGAALDLVGIHQNSIAGNYDWGLLNASAEEVDATYNWWGDVDGPYQATTNTGGGGDEVSDNVDFSDWLSAAPALCAEYVPETATPVTITVGDDGEDFSSIQAAIDDAEPGDIILVSPGTYSENLTIEKSLTLHSTDGAESTTIDGMVAIDLVDAATVTFGGADAGFTVTGSSPGFEVRLSSWSQLTIQGNSINGCDDNGIYVERVRRWSLLSVLDNAIADNSYDGISIDEILDFGEVRIEGNVISRNDEDGISVQTVHYAGALEIRDNIIEENSGTGINLFEYGVVRYGSSASIVDNEIRGNGFDGECNRGRGIRWMNVFDGSEGLVQGNTITGNARDGFYFDDVEHGSSLDLVNNLVADNGGRGIHLFEYEDGCAGLIQGNTITGNGRDGFYMSDDPSDGSRVTIEQNTITGNGGKGLRVDDVEDGGHLAIVDNVIEDNQGIGIYLYEVDSGSDCLIDGNTITNNAIYGVYVSSGADYGGVLTLTGNTISGTRAELHGVYVGFGCGGETYFYLGLPEFSLVPGSATIYLDGVEVSAADYYLDYEYGEIYFDTAPGDGVFISADYALENAGWGIYVNNDVDEGSVLTIAGNVVTDNLLSGIFIRDIGAQGAGAVIIEANTVSGNGAHGIAVGTQTFNWWDEIWDYYGVRNGSSLSMLDNEISDNAADGINVHQVDNGSIVRIDGNAVTGSCGAALWLCGDAETLKDSEAYVLGNVLDANDGWGLYGYLEHALLDVSGCNQVTSNAGGGIYLDGSDMGLVGIHNNNIKGNTEWGLLNDSDEMVDALTNWWGDGSGPYQADTNTAGLGDPVSDNVLYNPWMTASCEPSSVSAAFAASARSGAPGLSVRFTDRSTSGCDIVAWLWDFGDGGSSTAQNPTHVFLREGTFTVTLTVWDSCGHSDTITMQAYISIKKVMRNLREPSGDDAPEPASLGVSYLYIDPIQVLPGQTVTVSANVCNSGEERGNRTVSFMVNGEAVESQSVSVSGGACQQVTFTVARVVPGAYQVAIDGMVGQFSVVAPRTVTQSVASQQQTGLGTAGIIAIIAVMLVLIAALIMVFRRT